MKKTFNIILLICITTAVSMASGGYRWADGNSNISFVNKASAQLASAVKNGGDRFAKKIYKRVFYVPIWVEEKGLTRAGQELMDVVGTDGTLSGAMKSSKMLQKCRSEISKLRKSGGHGMSAKISLEMDMNRLYESYANHRITGGIHWNAFKDRLASLKESKKIDAQWVVYEPKFSAMSILRSIVAGNSVAAELAKTDQKRFRFKELKEYLAKYIDIRNSGKWKKLGGYHGQIQRGDISPLIPAVRNNLGLVGDLNGCDALDGSDEFDDCLVKGVKRFQLRNGAKATGKIDKKTYNMLKRSLSDRIKYIRLNLDKIKRFRRKTRDVRMELNIPSFRLNVLDGNELVDTIRVVVGKPDHPTPVFGNSVQYIVVNPWWKIPDSIVKNEMLKHLIKDPYYYERQGKVMHKTWDPDSERLDPGKVKWAKYKDKKYIPYRFMQVPSNKNALGKIKFMFPNNFSVYIHDTPSKSLFFKNYRAYSHGCMRIQKPRELLKVFAMYNPNINVDEIMDQLKTTKNSTINLDRSMPIDITYLTAFVDAYGNMNFRKDVYGYDKLLLKDYSSSSDVNQRVATSSKASSKKVSKKSEKKIDSKDSKDSKKQKHKKKAPKVEKNPVAKTESQIKTKKSVKKSTSKPVNAEELKTSEIYKKR